MSSFFRRQPTSSSVANGSAQIREDSASSSRTLTNFRDQIKKGLPVNLDTTALAAVVDAIRHSEAIDDRKLLLEHALTFVSKLPPGSIANNLQDKIIQLLYNDLPHPPATSIGNQYAWRAADGGSNNIDVPDMGRSGTSYARSVQQSHPLSENELPDSGLIFDTLLKREKFVKHPAGLSATFFSFAALVIHTVFRTSHTNVNVNETTSYVDLSPLYGVDQASQDLVRDKSGYGLLKPDVFAEDRLLLLPPAVCALLVLFNRNHNYIAKKLLAINERGTFEDPSKLSGERLAKQDEELFQTARLVNCGWFGSVVFSDYFSCILGLVRQGSTWSLSPFGEIRNADHSLFERGRGNICSVEFNCLYRWHATTSEHDEKWVNQVFEQVFDGKSPDAVTPADFKAAAAKIQKSEPDITHWTFGGIQRNEDGSFRDEDLANILQTATDAPAATFGARGTPASMRLHEMMGIEQNRRWGVCSLNDFRKYLGLKPFSSFLEWNSNPEIAEAAEKLYGDIDCLELYAGLQAEEAKPLVEGAGLCPGYTISRAILSDAIALTRGDRFFTHDFTPFNLTSWGFADCQRDPGAFGFGSTLGRLILRALPNHYSENSVYTFFPLMTPDSMQVHLKKLDVIEDYDLARPTPIAPVQTVRNYEQVNAILKSPDLVDPCVQRLSKLIKGPGFYTTGTDEKERVKVLTALAKSEANITLFFYEKTRDLIQKNSYTLVGGNVQVVDLVRDVLKVLPVYWVADIVNIPLKTKSSEGQYTLEELYTMLGEIYEYIFLRTEPANVMVLRAKVRSHIKKLHQHLRGHLTVAQRVSAFASMLYKPKKTDHHEIVKHLKEISDSTDQLSMTLLALMVGAVELSLAFTNTVNLYLGSSTQENLCSLATDRQSSLEAFVLEALRIDPPFKGEYRVVTKETMGIAQDSTVFLDVLEACHDNEVFSNAAAVDLSRPVSKYLTDIRCFRCLGQSLTVKVIGEVVRAVFATPSLQRAPGQSGILKRYKDPSRQELHYAYLDQQKHSCAWPTSMALQFGK